MFSENNKISLKQLKRLLVFDLFSVSGLIIPRIATAASGRDGVLAIILATLYAFIYVWIILSFAKCTNGNFLDYSTQYTGKILTFLIGTLYIVKLFICCVFAARLFGEVINQTLLEDTDSRVIILLLLCVSAYAASKGFEVRARIAEVLYFIVIVPVFVFLLLGLKEVNLTNIMPLFTRSAGDIIFGGYEVFLTFSILELLIFVAPLIRVKKSDITKGRKIHHAVSKALVIVGILNVLLFIVTVGILGEGETGQKLWSMVTVIQMIKMPGGFIQRQDAIILAIWMLSIFTIISAFFYFISLISKHIFKVPMQNYLLIPFILLIFAASVAPMETEQFFYYFEYYMKYIGMPQSIVLPAIVVLIGKLRKPKVNKAKAIVRSLLIFTTLMSAFSLTGCGDMTEIEDRNFIQALGIDLKDDKLTVNYVLPDLQALTGQGTVDPEKLKLELKGYNFIQIEDEYHLKYNKRLDFSHVKTIIIGKEFANDANQMEEFLTYVENKYELGRNTLVFISNTDANEILDLNGELEGGVGNYLDRLYRINLSNTGKEVINIGDLVYSMNNENPVISVPLLKANEKTLETVGFGFVAGNKLVYEVNENEADYIDISNGYGKNHRVFLSENPDNDLIERTNDSEINDVEKLIDEIIYENAKYVVKINNATRTLDFSWMNNKPFVTLSIEGIAIFEKGFKDTGLTSQAENAKLIEEVEHRCNEIVRSRIVQSMDKILKEAKVDYMNLYRTTSYKNRSMWLTYENREKDFLEDISYTVDVNFKIQ
jgi:spore germination protein (amino acid permease)